MRPRSRIRYGGRGSVDGHMGRPRHLPLWGIRVDVPRFEYIRFTLDSRRLDQTSALSASGRKSAIQYLMP
jgi:hypothetical protein